MQGFYKSACFSVSTRISQIRLIFGKSKDFLNSPNFWQKQGFFLNPPDFWQKQGFLKSA
jgi:hypothetical protein